MSMTIEQLFSQTGPLALALKGYQPRQAQIDMAQVCDSALKHSQQAIVEAETGTGKTFAYLLPALVNKGKYIISTGSKALQEQLYHRDLPTVYKALGSAKKKALLKGRANYVCHYRLNQHVAHVPSDDADIMHQLAMVAKFAAQTRSGDIADCVGIEDDAKVLPYVTSTADNCLGRECPDFDSCFIRKARQRAADADIVVINHHLFFADMAVKDSGFAELLPGADGYIFDEAHQLADIASDYFGETISTKKILAFITDARMLYRSELRDMLQLGKTLDKLESATKDMRLAFGSDGGRGDWRKALTDKALCDAIHRVNKDLAFLNQVLKLCLERSELVEPMLERLMTLKGQLDRAFDVSVRGYSYWYEATRYHLTIHITPLNIAAKFKEMLSEREAGFVFTSATLSVNDSLQHFSDALGLSPSRTLMLASPFDYQRQALLCLPRYLPEANSDAMPRALVGICQQVIRAAKGRCFLLFTSYRVMHMVAEVLCQQMDYPVFVQGQMSKRLLLERFTRHGNAVLMGTASFWEGVDVRGSALSCVVIDKLPFVAPDDPLLQARMQDCEQSGGEPFAQIQLPRAVIALKQGVGRLIRDSQDRGVLVLCDNRVITRDYGQVFLKSLPNMRRSRDMNEVNAFLAAID
ncbi:ATP-dependent DNA helicase [Pseudoalteromonas sp. CO325X]|uniref:ATP-dependent DNA helicase n=2 Tax=Pseudoalteromonas TaxID=53246 RepID=UPI0010235AEF|nr:MULTISPECIES: ATP-dependent DNA helicase [Pseudoalteromonas]RZF83406.1 ATP-dependent DNA helicase [Pseudoalteromonas sp. CO325X]